MPPVEWPYPPVWLWVLLFVLSDAAAVGWLVYSWFADDEEE